MLNNTEICVLNMHICHFRTNDILTAENMGTKKGMCAAALRLYNWRFMSEGIEKRCYNALLA